MVIFENVTEFAPLVRSELRLSTAAEAGAKSLDTIDVPRTFPPARRGSIDSDASACLLVRITLVEVLDKQSRLTKRVSFVFCASSIA